MEIIINPLGNDRASEGVVNYLITVGALYIDETGLHASESGIYPKKNSTTDR